MNLTHHLLRFGGLYCTLVIFYAMCCVTSYYVVPPYRRGGVVVAHLFVGLLVWFVYGVMHMP